MHIYTLYETGETDASVEKTLREYAQHSPHIQIENVDPVRNPTFAQLYDTQNAGIETGSIIVESESGGNTFFRVISPLDILAIDYATYTVTGLNIEQPVTSAIQYVSTGAVQRVKFLTGHGEPSLEEQQHLVSALANNNCEATSIHLLQDGNTLIPEEDILVVIGPQTDLQESEQRVIQEFLDAGGDMFCAFDPNFSDELDCFRSLLRTYGMDISQTVVIESNDAKYYNSPNILLPDMAEHVITSPLIQNNMFPVLPVSLAISIDPSTFTDTAQSGGLLMTSSASYAKTSADATMERGQDDPVGPFYVGAVGIRILDGEGSASRLAVYGTSQGFAIQAWFSLPGNTNLFLNSISWLTEGSDALSIQSKPLYDSTLTVPTQASANAMMVLLIGILPLLCLALGLVIWVRRSRK